MISDKVNVQVEYVSCGRAMSFRAEFLVLDTEQTVFVGQDLAAALGISVSGLSNAWADELPTGDELAIHAIDQPTPIWSPCDQVGEGDLAIIMKDIESALQEELLIRVAKGEHMPDYQNHYSYLFSSS